MMRLTLSIVLAVGCLILRPDAAHAIPVLQLYIEGSTYNTSTESWEIDVSSSAPGSPIRLWVIGNTAGPGNDGSIQGVTLVVSYSNADLGLDLTPTVVDGDGSYSGTIGQFNDPSTPESPTYVQTGNGLHPLLSADGEFGSNTQWQEYNLGDMTKKDSPIADFASSSPSVTNDKAQINAYDVSAFKHSGDASVVTLHFDVYGYTRDGTRFKFAPFSHDASATLPIAHHPEPSSLALLGIGAGGLFYGYRRRRASS